MSGAYTSLPEVVPIIQYPPDWNPSWTFPGPGTFSGLVLSAPATIDPQNPTISVLAVLGASSNAGSTPTGNLTYTATLTPPGGSAAPLNLRLASGSTLGSSVGTVYTADNGMFDSSPNLFFDISPTDDGSVIALTATGEPFGDSLTQTVSITVKNSKVYQIVATPSEGLSVDATGSTATFTVRLTESPAFPVTISLFSNNTLEGTINKSSLTFTSTAPQTVTITGQDDHTDHSQPVHFAIILGNAQSKDKHYSGKKPNNVLATNQSLMINEIVYEIVISGTNAAGGINIWLSSDPDNNYGFAETNTNGDIDGVASGNYAFSGDPFSPRLTATTLNGVYLMDWFGGATDIHGNPTSWSGVLNAKFYHDDTLISEYNKTVNESSRHQEIWLQLDTSTNTVTEVNITE